MKLLGIDTATEACSVALFGFGDNILESYKLEPRGHSKLVLTMLDGLLSDAGITLHDLDAIAIDSGPGSFTGIRIGFGIAQGLSLSLELPLIGVSSLMVLAEGSGPETIEVLPAIDARMGEVYWGRLSRDREIDEGWAWRDKASVDQPSFLPTLRADEIGIGSGWDHYPELVNSNTLANIEFEAFPRASWLVTIAARIMSYNKKRPSTVLPDYIRNNVVAKTTLVSDD
jgi:tRNA threonylcarbamoyladenosine biosynthesis protein TsaB